MKIYIGADHNGFHLKEELEQYLKKEGHEVVDVGDARLDPEDDFPIFAAKVVTAMLGSEESDPKGILLCGSGQGMCIAANRYRGIRAALGFDMESARATRNDEDSNVLCLPARVLKEKDAYRIVDAWLTTPFAGASRYIRRNKQLDELV